MLESAGFPAPVRCERYMLGYSECVEQEQSATGQPAFSPRVT